MKKHGTKSKALVYFKVYLSEMQNTSHSRQIMRFLNKYCIGLQELEKLQDRDSRISLRKLWRDDFFKKLETFHKHKLDDYGNGLLLNVMTYFYREKERRDILTRRGIKPGT